MSNIITTCDETYIEYAGCVKNNNTNKYDILFTTEISGYLALLRAKETAENENNTFSANLYNPDDIIVKSRRNYIKHGRWTKYNIPEVQ